MIKERTIEQAQDGSFFATNAVTMIYEDMDGRNITFYIDPDSLFDTVHDGIKKMSQTEEGDTSNMSPEMQTLKRQMTKVMRAGIKGILLMWGQSLMKLFYGSDSHPKPPKDKHLDVIAWYLSEFSKLLIANMMKHDIVLKGQRVDNHDVTISVDEVCTRPVTGVTP